MSAGSNPERLVLLIAEYGYFLSHRLALAEAAVRAGYQVTVITRVPAGTTPGIWPGVEVCHLDMPRGMGHPVADAHALWLLTRMLRRLRPVLLHSVSVKLILLGSAAAWLAGVPAVLNAYTGLGVLFHSPSRMLRCMRAVLLPVLAFLVRRTRAWALFQNPDDQARMQSLGLARAERSALVCGAGVDTDVFRPAPEATGDPVVLFVARLLRDKGIEEFVAAARALKLRGIAARFIVAGTPDPENPRSISEAQLAQWRRTEPVEWLGQVADMPGLLARVHIVCLPSYHEGVPKALLEAAASGKPVVATDIPGCRMVVVPGETGILVPVADAKALGDALEKVIADPELRRALGANGRSLALQRFSVSIINEQIMELYQRMRRS